MNSAEIPAPRLARLLEERGTAELTPWSALLRTADHQPHAGAPAPTRHWLDIYRRRLQTATTTQLADALSVVVHVLTEYEGDSLRLVMLHRPGEGCLLWLTPELTHIVTHFTGQDRRPIPPSG
ncbi:hypothetical protein [Streptomyces sp. NBRC 109706]|uniref:hypothetical protein n=1 Tax=Streptomyces sp. NBRC 109706 TaxID=1550035 RepID=UPI000782C506|nr:hypothetical protein [Streptomyces sp. NBRC 109706]